jgi:hypothetical protein
MLSNTILYQHDVGPKAHPLIGGQDALPTFRRLHKFGAQELFQAILSLI